MTEMNTIDYNQALQEWKQALGEINTKSDRDSISLYTQNVGGLERRIPAILIPHSTEEVQQLVCLSGKPA